MSYRTQDMRLLFWLGSLALVLACAAVLARTQTSLATQALDKITGEDEAEAEAEVTPQTVVSKKAVPAISKRVQEDATGAWGMTADAQRGQSLSFMLTGTLPSNFEAFGHYHYRFEDTLSQGLTLSITEGSTAADSIAISFNDQVVDAHAVGLSVSYEANVLVVDFADLKDPRWAGFNVSKDTVITIVYQAHLNQTCLLGMTGNDNTAKLVYTKEPTLGQDGETPQVTTRVFCYALQLTKVSDSDGKALAQAEFSIRVADDNTYQASRGLYVQKDGTLGETECSFVSDSSGIVQASGLDEGSYLIKEVKAPSGYQRSAKDLVIKIDARRDDEARTLSALEATIVSGKARLNNVSAEVGLVELCVENSPVKSSSPTKQLPQTGVGPIAAFLIVAGLAILAISRVSDIRRKWTRHSSS